MQTHRGLVTIVGDCCLLGGHTSIPPASHKPHCHKPPLACAALGSASKSAGTWESVGRPPGDPPALSSHARQHNSPTPSFQLEAPILSISQ